MMAPRAHFSDGPQDHRARGQTGAFDKVSQGNKGCWPMPADGLAGDERQDFPAIAAEHFHPLIGEGMRELSKGSFKTAAALLC
jgi:hypothetical protein